jgi:hypothetical protein
MLARNCVLLEIPVDPERLWISNDAQFLHWMSELVEMVNAEHRKQSRKSRG